MTSPQRLFVYGTLCDPAIRLAVFGRDPAGAADSLDGFTLGHVAIRSEEPRSIYPILRRPGLSSAPVTGMVLEVTEAELAMADAYEGPYYTRLPVTLESGCASFVYAEPDYVRVASATWIIDAPIGKVWAVTSSFGVLQAWMPGLTSVSITGSGIGAIRTVEWAGAHVDEQIYELDADHHHIRYALFTNAMPSVIAPRGGNTLTAIDAGTTRIEWICEVLAIDGDPAQVVAMLEGFMAGSIGGLARFLGVGARPE